MASSYTTNYGIEKIGSGEQSGAWGTTTNHNLDILDRIASFKAVAISGSTHTLTVREASPDSGTENLQDGMFRVISAQHHNGVFYLHKCHYGLWI